MASVEELTKQWEKDAAVVLRAYWKRPPLSGPVALWIDAYKARPKRLLRLSDPSCFERARHVGREPLALLFAVAIATTTTTAPYNATSS